MNGLEGTNEYHKDGPSGQIVIGKRLAALRQAFGLTQSQICDKIECGTNTWNNYERGLAIPPLIFGVALVRAFPITLDWLYMGKANGVAEDIQARLTAAGAPGQDSP